MTTQKHEPAATQHPAPPPAHDPPAATTAPADHPATTPAPPAPPKPAPYVVPKALAGGKAALELQIIHTAGGDVKFIVVSVTNALEPIPGSYLTLDQVEAIGAAGWTITAVAR